jgi:hypothetical protein
MHSGGRVRNVDVPLAAPSHHLVDLQAHLPPR